MTADIRRLLEARPFVPFSVVTSGGMRYRVASPDHADINPQGSRLVVWFDDESGVICSAIHIANLETEKPRAA